MSWTPLICFSTRFYFFCDEWIIKVHDMLCEFMDAWDVGHVQGMLLLTFDKKFVSLFLLFFFNFLVLRLGLSWVLDPQLLWICFLKCLMSESRLLRSWILCLFKFFSSFFTNVCPFQNAQHHSSIWLCLSRPFEFSTRASFLLV